MKEKKLQLIVCEWSEKRRGGRATARRICHCRDVLDKERRGLRLATAPSIGETGKQNFMEGFNDKVVIITGASSDRRHGCAGGF